MLISQSGPQAGIMLMSYTPTGSAGSELLTTRFTSESLLSFRRIWSLKVFSHFTFSFKHGMKGNLQRSIMGHLNLFLNNSFVNKFLFFLLVENQLWCGDFKPGHDLQRRKRNSRTSSSEQNRFFAESIFIFKSQRKALHSITLKTRHTHTHTHTLIP